MVWSFFYGEGTAGSCLLKFKYPDGTVHDHDFVNGPVRVTVPVGTKVGFDVMIMYDPPAGANSGAILFGLYGSTNYAFATFPLENVGSYARVKLDPSQGYVIAATATYQMKGGYFQGDGNVKVVANSNPIDIIISDSIGGETPLQCDGGKSITIKSSPSTAFLSIDGNDIGYTPQTLCLSTTSHTVVLSKPGYQTKVETINVGFWNPTEYLFSLTSGTEPIETPSSCKLLLENSCAVTSEPMGALVNLNGKNVGITPTRICALTYGQNQITLTLTGYKPYVSETWVGNHEDFDVALEPVQTDIVSPEDSLQSDITCDVSELNPGDSFTITVAVQNRGSVGISRSIRVREVYGDAWSIKEQAIYIEAGRTLNVTFPYTLPTNYSRPKVNFCVYD